MKRFVFAVGKVPINVRQKSFELAFQRLQMKFDGLREDAQIGLFKQHFLLLPSLVINQILFKAAEGLAGAARQIAGLERVGQGLLDEKFITVRTKLPLVGCWIRLVKIAERLFGQETEGEFFRIDTGQRLFAREGLAQKMDGLR